MADYLPGGFMNILAALGREEAKLKKQANKVRRQLDAVRGAMKILGGKGGSGKPTGKRKKNVMSPQRKQRSLSQQKNGGRRLGPRRRRGNTRASNFAQGCSGNSIDALNERHYLSREIESGSVKTFWLSFKRAQKLNGWGALNFLWLPNCRHRPSFLSLIFTFGSTSGKAMICSYCGLYPSFVT
jgi:hypothetical protein